MALLLGVMKAVLNADDSYIRFENFVLELYSQAEGIELVPTSRTRDSGRDGRSVLIGMTAIRPVLCATLQTEIDEKVESDIRRLTETTQTNAIVYCTSKPLTEEKCDALEAKIRELYTGVESVRVLGQIQLIGLIERHEDVFQKYYAAEIKNVQEALLLTPTATLNAREVGLRLALCTQVGDDARELRSELARCLVLYTLLNQGPLTPARLASAITVFLHLPRALSADYLREILKQLATNELVSIENDIVQLTESGTNVASQAPEEAGIKLLEGRRAIREAIKRLSGHTISEIQFEELWNVFQDGITELFHSHGLSMIKMVRSILAEDLAISAMDRIDFPIDRLADRVATVFTDSTLAQEIRQAIIDMFSEKGSPAFQWLTQICGVYLMMCSLGLETLSSQQIIRVLSTYHIVPDSDIVISLLCEGEENHEDVKRILLGWKAVGGTLVVTIPVLEEVAYHAWISDYDYGLFGPNLNRLSDYDAKHVLDNAFVRAFRRVAGEMTAPKYWYKYSGQFRGNSEYDYARIIQNLREDYGFDILPEAGEEYSTLAKKVRDFLINRVSKYTKTDKKDLDYRIISKAGRDGRLVAAVYAERRSRHAQGDFTTTCIVSSAVSLREVDAVFRKELGPPYMVLSTVAVSFLLTLTPQVSMGFGTLRSVLFDTGLAVRVTSAQLYAYRLIAASGQWDVPWSRRVTLQRELSEVLYQEARSKGEPVAIIRNKVLGTEEPEYSASIIATTLDRMAITPKSREELLKTKAELKKAQEELAALKSLKKAPFVSKKRRLQFQRKPK